jgi:hypothetical protein
MRLSDEERELVRTETVEAMEFVRAPDLRAKYARLLTALDDEIPGELVEVMQSLLEVGLQSGRIRRVHHAPGEMAARRLYGRTPRGSAARSAAEEVNDALRALAGQTIDELRVAAAGPGVHTLSVSTDQGTVLLEFDRHGARLRSVEVGG